MERIYSLTIRSSLADIDRILTIQEISCAGCEFKGKECTGMGRAGKAVFIPGKKEVSIAISASNGDPIKAAKQLKQDLWDVIPCSIGVEVG